VNGKSRLGGIKEIEVLIVDWPMKVGEMTSKKLLKGD
jgi:hypothetical protein